MTDAVASRLPDPSQAAARALAAAAGLWLAVAVIGQWAFLYYIAGFYGPSTATGDFAAWTRNPLLFRGYVAGDAAGNATFAAHALAAGIIAFGGALQLVPQIRARAPAFHRWNGRVFLATAVGLSLTGFWLVWGRGPSERLVADLAITLNGLLILAFAALAWRSAVARRTAVHRRWALRLYLVCNAQWFLRVGVFAWLMANQAAGREVSFASPFVVFWTFGCYLVPLAGLQAYLWAKDRAGPAGQLAVAGGLLLATALMALGAFGFTALMMQVMDGTLAVRAAA